MDAITITNPSAEVMQNYPELAAQKEKIVLADMPSLKRNAPEACEEEARPQNAGPNHVNAYFNPKKNSLIPTIANNGGSSNNHHVLNIPSAPSELVYYATNGAAGEFHEKLSNLSEGSGFMVDDVRFSIASNRSLLEMDGLSSRRSSITKTVFEMERVGPQPSQQGQPQQQSQHHPEERSSIVSISSLVMTLDEHPNHNSAGSGHFDVITAPNSATHATGSTFGFFPAAAALASASSSSSIVGTRMVASTSVTSRKSSRYRGEDEDDEGDLHHPGNVSPGGASALDRKRANRRASPRHNPQLSIDSELGEIDVS